VAIYGYVNDKKGRLDRLDTVFVADPLYHPEGTQVSWADLQTLYSGACYGEADRDGVWTDSYFIRRGDEDDRHGEEDD
jgi:hypothetical protein